MIYIFKRLYYKEQIPLVFGYGNAVIVTGSMEPTIRIGDIIIIHSQNEYEINDIVTYHGTNNPVTHRINEITQTGYITRGDANNASDGDIEKSRIIGKVILTVPGAGNVILFFQQPLGMMLLIIGLFAMIELPRVIKKLYLNYKENKNEKN